jgi:hypothetical protein
MYIKRLSEIFVQKAFLIFEILSFEVYCRSDRLPDSTLRESATLRINDTRSRFLRETVIGGKQCIKV